MGLSCCVSKVRKFFVPKNVPSHKRTSGEGEGLYSE